MTVEQHPSGHDNPRVAAVIFVLRDWYEALENGAAAQRFPDPSYQRRRGEPDWTDAEVDRVIETIDREIAGEMYQRPAYWRQRGFQVPTEFSRLAPLQRRAMVQQIDNALRTPAAS